MLTEALHGQYGPGGTRVPTMQHKGQSLSRGFEAATIEAPPIRLPDSNGRTHREENDPQGPILKDLQDTAVATGLMTIAAEPAARMALARRFRGFRVSQGN